MQAKLIRSVSENNPKMTSEKKTSENDHKNEVEIVLMHFSGLWSSDGDIGWVWGD